MKAKAAHPRFGAEAAQRRARYPDGVSRGAHSLTIVGLIATIAAASWLPVEPRRSLRIAKIGVDEVSGYQTKTAEWISAPMLEYERVDRVWRGDDGLRASTVPRSPDSPPVKVGRPKLARGVLGAEIALIATCLLAALALHLRARRRQTD